MAAARFQDCPKQPSPTIAMAAFGVGPRPSPRRPAIARKLVMDTHRLLIAVETGIARCRQFADQPVPLGNGGQRFRRPLTGLGAQHLTELGYVVRRERG